VGLEYQAANICARASRGQLFLTASLRPQQATPQVMVCFNIQNGCKKVCYFHIARIKLIGFYSIFEAARKHGKFLC